MDCSMPGLPVHHQLPELTQTHVHWVGDAIQSSHPLLSPSPPASGSFLMSPLFTSDRQSIGISAPASVLPMNIQDWFLLGLTGLISMLSNTLPQHHNSKASILQHSAFFMDQLSHPEMTAGKTIALNIWTLVGKVMSLLFNTLSWLLIAFLPKCKCIWILWL